jgi:hypothetical protein
VDTASSPKPCPAHLETKNAARRSVSTGALFVLAG